MEAFTVLGDIMSNQVRKITEGAMMIALFGIMLVIDRQFAGVLAYYLMFIMPLPIIIYCAKYGMKDGIVVGVAIMLVSLMLASPQSIFLTIVACVVGVTYGTLVFRKTNNGILLIITMMACIIAEVLMGITFASFFGMDLNTTINETSVMVNSILDTISGTQNAASMLSFELDGLIRVIAIMSVVITGVMEGIIVHILANFILTRLKYDINPIKQFIDWNVPKWLGYLLFFSMILMVVSPRIIINEAFLNVILVCGIVSTVVLFMFGFLATILCGVVKYRKKYTGLLILVTIILFYIVVPVLCVIGFIYISTDMKQQLLKGVRHG